MNSLIDRFKTYDEFGKDYKLVCSFLSNSKSSTISKQWFKGKKCKEKSTKLSIHFRQQANVLFKSKQFPKAYDKMKDCLKYGRTDDADDLLNTGSGSSLSVAFKNRSTIHYFDKRYEESISDIDMAIECGYPLESQYNLYLSKGKAHVILFQQVKGIHCFEKALELFEEHCNVEPETKVAFTKQMRVIIQDAKNKAKDTKDIPSLNPVVGMKIQEMMYCKCPGGIFSCTDIYCDLNNTVEIRKSSTGGRGLFLKKRVSKGAAIFIDKSCASIVGKILNDEKCHFCMKDLDCRCCLPCKFCADVLFCSRKCFTEGWEKFHKFECGLMGHLRSLKNFARMSYRVFVQSSPSNSLGVLRELGKAVEHAKAGKDLKAKHNLPMEGFKDGVYQAKTYFGLFHMDAGTRTHDLEYNRKALEICLKLLQLYEQKCESLGVTGNWDLNLVGLDGGVTSTEKRALQMTILFHHYKQCVNHNVMKIQNKWNSGNTMADAEEHRTGYGSARMFPIGCLINHSHRPTVNERFDDEGVHCFYRPLRDMKAGEELTIDYDRACDLMDGSTLTFSCRCPMCTVLPGSTDEDICLQTKLLFCEFCCEMLPPGSSALTCKDCFDLIFIADSIYRVYMEGIRLVQSGDYEGAIKMFKSCVIRRDQCGVSCFSSLINMSWMGVTLSYHKTGAFDEVIEYATLVLGSLDTHLCLSVYKFAELLSDCSGKLWITRSAIAIWKKTTRELKSTRSNWKSFCNASRLATILV